MKLVVKTFQGLEEVLMQEIIDLGGENVKIGKRAVTCSGDKEFLYRANLNLRTALRILVPIYQFKADTEDEFYEEFKKKDWSEFMHVDTTFAIDSVVFSHVFKHSKFISLKAKDAIADQFREKTGKRPSVNPKNPDLQFSIHIAANNVTVSFDSSVQPLNRRGYRSDKHEAPLNEVLAAGMIKLANWSADTPLIDPFCGSGTILMEAAMMACNIPPGLKRKEFGFMRWQNFEQETWDKVFQEGYSQLRSSTTEILGHDISGQAIDMVKEASITFDLFREIRASKKSFERFLPELRSGTVITNPPYGERLEIEDINEFYRTIGERLQNYYQNFDVWLITSNEEALEQITIEPADSIELYNGALKCKFNHYKLYEGEHNKASEPKKRRYIRKKAD